MPTADMEYPADVDVHGLACIPSYHCKECTP